jgi:uncharacterized protein with HEPN domain
MRRDELYLSDIMEAADSVAAFIASCDRAAFVDNDLLRSAVLHKLTVIGEAAARVSAELRERHPEIEWPDIVGFRNIAVHAYFAVDWSIVWSTAAHDAPQLRRQVFGILTSEFNQ